MVIICVNIYTTNIQNLQYQPIKKDDRSRPFFYLLNTIF